MDNVKKFVIADTHFYHTNIIESCNRPYDNAEQMNEDYIQKWNEVVRQHDKVYMLGDFSFANKELTTELVSRLNGFIYLVIGNHDRRHSAKWLLECGFKNVYEFPIVYGYVNGLPLILSHRPVPVSEMDTFYNIHGHIHNSHYGYPTHFNCGIDIIKRPIEIKDFTNHVNLKSGVLVDNEINKLETILK